MRYTLRHDEIHNVDDDASVFIQDEEGERTTSLVGQTFTYDRRDDRFLPSEGYFLRFDQDLAGLGGDNRFIRHEVRAEYYYSIVPDVVFNLSGSGGYIRGFGGEDVHLSNRFFLGGANLRGFQFAGIGPRDSDDRRRAGRQSLLRRLGRAALPAGPARGAAHLRAHLRRCRLAAATSTSAARPSTRATACGSAAGVGLSWLSPLGPLSIDFAQAVKKEDEDKTEFFRLSFGTRF